MSFAIVIPSRTASNLAPCLEAIYKNEPGIESGQIIVIDDGLENPERFDGLCRRIMGHKPFIFSRACNQGIESALGAPVVIDTTVHSYTKILHDPNADAVILLNDDALLQTEKGFTSLAATAASHPKYGVIGAVANSTGNPNQFPRNKGLRDEPRMVCFVCVLIPRRTIDAIGLLDERFTAYGFEDDDYCLRARKAGLKIGVFDGCMVNHTSLQSTFRAGRHAPLEPGLAIFKEKWGMDNWGRPA